jgi:hypothetical protein
MTNEHAGDSPSPNASPNLGIVLDVDESLTWGELFWFAEQARKSGVNPADPVTFNYDMHQEFQGFLCFVFPEDLDKS